MFMLASFFSNCYIEVPGFRQVIEATLHFETSAKWPDDFEAIQHVKTAFYLKIAELLQEDQQRCVIYMHLFNTTKELCQWMY